LQTERNRSGALHGVLYHHALNFRGLYGEDRVPNVVAGLLVDIKPQRVLDLGSGSGSWCLDIAE